MPWPLLFFSWNNTPYGGCFSSKINFASTNNFIFNLDGKFKIKNLQITSKVDLKELSIKNNFELKNFLPGLDKNILFKNHLINIDYEKDKLNISGKGSALFQKEESKIDYTFEQNKELINLKTNLEIGKNPIKLSFINYDKKKNLDSNLKLEIISKDEKHFLIKELNFKTSCFVKSLNKLLNCFSVVSDANW